MAIKKGNIGNALHSVAPDHTVTTADEVFDETQNKYQNEINSDISEYISDIIESDISSIEANIGYYECDTAAGTAAKVITVANYALFVGGSIKVKFVNKNTVDNATLNINSQGAKDLYYQGERASATNSWNANEVVEIYYDGTSYYANNINGGSGSGVYDVSKEHPTSGPNSDGKFTLKYILNSSNVNELIPVNKRYPGMSIQFVSSSDNKYVQYRLMTQAFSTTESDWQGVDSEPTPGSKNLVEGSGIVNALWDVEDEIFDVSAKTFGRKFPSTNTEINFTINSINVVKSGTSYLYDVENIRGGKIKSTVNVYYTFLKSNNFVIDEVPDFCYGWVRESNMLSGVEIPNDAKYFWTSQGNASKFSLTNEEEGAINKSLNKTDVAKVSVAPSINIVDYSRLTYGAALKTDGEIYKQVADTYAISDYIPVNGQNIATNGYNYSPYCAIHVYDSDFNFIRSVSDSKNYIYSSGNDETYIRIAFFDAQTESNVRANYGNELKDYAPYSPIGEYIKGISLDINQLNQSKVDIKIGTNIVNYDKIEIGKALRGDGSIRDVTDTYAISDYIPVNGQNIATNGYASSNGNYVAYHVYNSQKERIRVAGTLEKQYTFQDGDYYIRVTFGNVQEKSNVRANYGNTLKEYEPYSPIAGYLSSATKRKVVTLGDSYCAGGIWQGVFAQESNMDFDADLNNNRYSVSAAVTCGYGDNAHERAKLLVADNLIVPDVIILENVNDNAWVDDKAGTQSDEPFMSGNLYNLDITALSTKADAQSYFSNNLSTILSGITPVHGYRVGVPYEVQNATKITFSSGASADGKLIINYATKNREIGVIAGETVSEIIDAILEFAWNGFEVKKEGNDSVVFSPTKSATNVSINVGNTGVTATVQGNQTGQRSLIMAYPLHDMTSWESESAWKEIDNISIWSSYKGLYNYLSQQFPNAELYQFLPIAYECDVNDSNYKNPDNTLDTDAINSSIKFGELYSVQKDIAEYCHVKVLDISDIAGIYPQNVATYFSANNYHPNINGYKKWGLAVSKLLPK